MANFFPEGMPLPAGDRDTQPFWDYCRQHELRIQRCARCGAYRFHPQPVCYNCQSFEHEWVRSKGLGEVYTFAVVYHPNHPAEANAVPFNLTVVQLEDCGQVKLTTNLVDVPNEEIHIGMPVELTWEDTTPDTTLYRFRPRRPADPEEERRSAAARARAAGAAAAAP